MSYWKANAASESKKLGTSSPTWRGIAGAGHSGDDPLLDRQSRSVRSRKRLFDSSSSEEEDEEDAAEEAAEEAVSSDPSYQRVLLEVNPLRDLLVRNMVCKICKGPVLVEFPTVTIASWVKIACAKTDCSFIDYGDKPQPAAVVLPAGSRNVERNTDYAVNVLYVLGFLMSGDGGKEAARILGVVGLPNDTTMESRSFPTIERRVGPTIRQITQDILMVNLEREVEATWKKDDCFSVDVFELWKASIRPSSTVDFPINLYPRIVVAFDFAWNTRGGGNAYQSNSGFGCMVGGLCRQPVTQTIKSKYCRLCSSGVDLEAHVCLMNHHGSSKAMEPIACADMFMELFDRFHCCAVYIVTDDDSSIKSKLKYTHDAYKAVNNTTEAPRIYDKQGKSKLAKDTGMIPARVPSEPKWYADPNHRKKTLRKELARLADKTEGNNLTMTKCGAIRISHNFGYFCRTLKNIEDESQYIKAAECVLDHHFDFHDNCGPWCQRRILTEQERIEAAKFYRSKEKDAKLYTKLKEIIAKYISMDRLRECAHGYDTQVNESLNNCVAWLAPKNKMYCATYSLTNRVSVAVGMVSVGMLEYYRRLYKSLGIELSAETHHFLFIKDRSRAKKLKYAATTEGKLKRLEKKAVSLKRETAVAKREKAQREGTYGSGIGLMGDVDDGYDYDELTEAQKELTCKRCQRAGHKSAANKLCPYYKPRQRKKKQCTASAPIATTTQQASNDAIDSARMDSLALTEAVSSDDEFFDADQYDGDEEEAGEGIQSTTI